MEIRIKNSDSEAVRDAKYNLLTAIISQNVLSAANGNITSEVVFIKEWPATASKDSIVRITIRPE